MPKLRKIRINLLDWIKETLPETEEETKYFVSLGRFITRFSNTEKVLNHVIHKYSKIEWEMAKALIMPIRVENAITSINRIIYARKLRGPKIEELKAIMRQLGHINSARNAIVHLGVSTKADSRGRFWSTNINYAPKSRIKRFPMSIKILDRMSDDLIIINFKLLVHIGIHIPPNPRGVTKLVYLLLRVFRGSQKVHAQTWLYRPPLQAPHQKASRARTPTRAAPPRSSSA